MEGRLAENNLGTKNLQGQKIWNLKKNLSHLHGQQQVAQQGGQFFAGKQIGQRGKDGQCVAQRKTLHRNQTRSKNRVVVKTIAVFEKRAFILHQVLES